MRQCYKGKKIEIHEFPISLKNSRQLPLSHPSSSSRSREARVSGVADVTGDDSADTKPAVSLDPPPVLALRPLHARPLPLSLLDGVLSRGLP